MADVFELIREDLVRVEAQLGKDSVSPVPAITDIGTYLQQSGGKRIRPALVLLTARLVACDGEAVIRLAAVVEMIHNATLIHDDIIDEADTRRGRPSTNSRWGTHMCVLAGDWLYMQAFNVALRERSFAVLDTLIGLTQTMVEGELMQLQTVGTVIAAAQHYELMERKTAQLFAVSSKLGAMAAAQPAEVIQRLHDYGHHLGLAFQMVDDLLDFTGDPGKVGKPVGNDLREGKMTLPAIYAYQQASAAEREALVQAMQGNGSGDMVAAVAILERYGALERARGEAARHALQAQELMRGFPRTEYREALEQLPDLVLQRDR